MYHQQSLDDDNMKRTVLIALAAATLLKLLLAWFTVGTNDVVTWSAFAHNARLCGVCVYTLAGPYGDPFNHPPFIIHFLKALPDTEMFPFWLRLPSILADIGTAFLVSRLLPSLSPRTLVLLALNPISILISGFHGNTDPVMIFFVVLAIYLMKIARPNWTAAAFGMAINIKVVPLLVLPAVFFYLRTWKTRFLFILIAASVVLALSIPYVLSDPLTIMKATLGYAGMYGKWGTSRILIAFPLSEAGHDIAGAVLRLLIVVVSLAVAWWMNRRRVDLFLQTGLILFLFLYLTPSLGVQYLVWAAPFVVALGFGWSFAYYVSAGLHLFLTYNYWSQGQWYYADSHIEPAWSFGSYMAGFLCWAICGLICLRYKQILTYPSAL